MLYSWGVYFSSHAIMSQMSCWDLNLGRESVKPISQWFELLLLEVQKKQKNLEEFVTIWDYLSISLVANITSRLVPTTQKIASNLWISKGQNVQRYTYKGVPLMGGTYL